MFIMLEITANGQGSTLTVKCDIGDEYSESLLEVMLDLIAVKE